MANWSKLNKEFDNLIDNLTDEQWNEWLSMKETHKAIDNLNLLIKAKLREPDMLKNAAVSSNVIVHSMYTGSQGDRIDGSLSVSFNGQNTFALAA